LLTSAARSELPELHRGPVRRPRRWREFVNEPQTSADVKKLRASIARGRPFGDAPSSVDTAQELGIESSLQPLGRSSQSRAADYSGDD
jgi:putative transposase